MYNANIQSGHSLCGISFMQIQGFPFEYAYVLQNAMSFLSNVPTALEETQQYQR